MVFKAIQRNGYDDTLMNGPKSSWLGYSLLPEGQHQKNCKSFKATHSSFFAVSVL